MGLLLVGLSQLVLICIGIHGEHGGWGARFKRFDAQRVVEVARRGVQQGHVVVDMLVGASVVPM